ncbi:Tat (twin-arginine translocation) pathway signal sequence [Natronorubrum thiooxidans]|uniref:Tat (Twin-arginine translocation) pathway signal sequence n=1 Tax=Natronorubrum thiooxidans TaxID=308853 RepID=A0A1N7GJ99_9EURY|nr:twin-arginine translocation signal domain-containing protein [Natronorubrum thiooxidans]SIS12578.1 Tat (twin-arginine translocation) pathway signal sequence [Natronorubrum thiooxidans]
MRMLRRLPLSAVGHEILEAVGLLTLAMIALVLFLFVTGVGCDIGRRLQPTAHDLELPSDAIARRSFMQRVGVGAAAIATGAASSGTVLANADEETEPLSHQEIRAANDGGSGVFSFLSGFWPSTIGDDGSERDRRRHRTRG